MIDDLVVDRTISPSDAMFGGNSDHYFDVGSSALECMLHAVNVARIRPASILDFGCGAGRVTRWIIAGFPDARVEGCDLREADIGFVADRFGIRTWKSTTNVASLTPPSTYDLIWVGSIFTHLSRENSTALFDKLLSWLNPSGVLVLTSHGRHPAAIGPQSGFYGIAPQWKRVKSDFERSGFGYADYADTPGYGISLVQLSWWAALVTSRANARLISITERAWDDHQDMIAAQRTG